MRNLRHDTLLWTVCTEHYFPVTPTIRADHTRLQYQIAISDLGESIGRRATIGDLSDDNVCRMMRHLQDRGLATRTINERRGRLNTLWGWLAKRGHVKHWPTVKRLPEPVRTPQAWSKDELSRLFVAISDLHGEVGTTPAKIWWRCLLLVLWDTGERIGALLSIGWEHIDVESKWLTIPAEMRKGNRRDMAYRLADDTIELLKLMPRTKGKPVFNWPMSRLYLWQKYEVILKAAGLPYGRKDKFHRIRRSVASHFEAAGGNATNLLGHSTRATTLVYIDPKVVAPPQATDLLFRLAPSERQRNDPPDKAVG